MQLIPTAGGLQFKTENHVDEARVCVRQKQTKLNPWVYKLTLGEWLSHCGLKPKSQTFNCYIFYICDSEYNVRLCVCYLLQWTNKFRREVYFKFRVKTKGDQKRLWSQQFCGEFPKPNSFFYAKSSLKFESNTIHSFCVNGKSTKKLSTETSSPTRVVCKLHNHLINSSEFTCFSNRYQFNFNDVHSVIYDGFGERKSKAILTQQKPSKNIISCRS